MDENPPLLVLDRIDARRNMARYYVMSIEPTLFSEVALVRHWGRLGTAGQRKLDLHATRDEAVAALQRLARSKLRRGYTTAARGMAAWRGQAIAVDG